MSSFLMCGSDSAVAQGQADIHRGAAGRPKREATALQRTCEGFLGIETPSSGCTVSNFPSISTLIALSPIHVRSRIIDSHRNSYLL